MEHIQIANVHKESIDKCLFHIYKLLNDEADRMALMGCIMDAIWMFEHTNECPEILSRVVPTLHDMMLECVKTRFSKAHGMLRDLHYFVASC
jgi:hypothetical protein